MSEYILQEIYPDAVFSPRVETGPIQFGKDDWPGIFIRGDNAFGYAMSLRRIIDSDENDPINQQVLLGLLSLLESSNVNNPDNKLR